MAAVWSKVLSFALQMVFARLRGKSTAIIDCCTPRPLLSFAAEPVINDNACRYGPLPRNFPAPHSARLIGMLSSEAWVGKRDSSLAIERIPENAKRVPEFKYELGTDRCLRCGIAEEERAPAKFRRSFDLACASRLPPSRRPAWVTPTTAVPSVGQTAIIAPS